MMRVQHGFFVLLGPCMNLKRHFFRLTLWALACGLMAGVQAQSAWPSKPLRIVVPFAPGSFTDLSARALAV